VATRTVQAESVHRGFTFCRIDNLAHAQQGRATRDGQEFCGSCVCCGGVYFLVGVRDLDSVVMLENSEQRCSVERRVNQTGEFRVRQVASLDRKWFVDSLANALDFDQAVRSRQAKTRRDFVFSVDHGGRNDF